MKNLISILVIISTPFLLTCGGSSSKSTGPSGDSCQVTLTSPIAASTWTSGENRSITWNSTGNCGTSVKLELYKGASKLCDIEASTSNDGSQGWTVSDCGGGSGTDYRIRITNISSGVSDYSDNFSITVGNPCQILVTSPIQSTSWTVETTQNISWNHPGNCGANVKIELYKGATKFCDISESTTNDGGFAWTVEDCGGGSDFDYRVKITDLTSGVIDYSDNFKILANDTCMLRMIFPNSSASFTVADQTTIRWDMLGNCGNNVRIDLLKADVLACNIVTSTPNNGSYVWDVFHCGSTGSDYSVKITDLTSGEIIISEYFSITSLF